MKSTTQTKIKLFAVTLFALFSITILSTQNTSVLFAQESQNNIEELEQKEQEREDDFLTQLLLDIPTVTDNPSHIITFIDPSVENNGVELDIDQKGFEQIRSPYALPALGIGKHELRFRFTDKLGSVQMLESDIVIIPRPPIISSPVFLEDVLEITGSGLSNSELSLILSSDRNIILKETLIDDEGNWQITVSNEELTEGVFTFTAFTKKYGYASNLADPITFEIGQSNNLLLEDKEEIYFSFKDISLDNIGEIFSQNLDLGLLIGGSFILGFFISLTIFSLVKGSLDNKAVKTFEKKLQENGTKPKKELTLKERLSGQKETQEEKEPEKETKAAKKEKVKKEKKREIEDEKGKTEKILTKIDFLHNYKKFDPDDDQGKEKDNIEVKVTSKN